MNTSTNLYLSNEIIGQEVAGDTLSLQLADGGRYEIPLPMLGHFRVPFAPHADAELLILEASPSVETVSVTDQALIVTFADGRVLSAPLSWFPRLWHGTPAERQAVEIWGETGLHWETLDEDIDAVELFRMTGPSAESAASILRWLAQRDAQRVKTPVGVEALQLAEKGENYSTE